MNRIIVYIINFLIFISLAPHSLRAQNDIYLFIDSTTIIGKISDNKVYVSETEIDYTVQGNIIFTGDTNATKNILFTVNAKDILSKKVGLVYQNDAKTIQYITQNSSFFLGDHPIDKENEKLLTFEFVNDTLYNIIDGINNKMIGFLQGKLISQVQIVVAAHTYIKHYGLDDQVRKVMNTMNFESTGTTISYIHPYLDRGPYFEWVWDGKNLKPVWGYRPEDEWEFDGKYLKPVWSADPQTEWIWDGSLLKPSWENSTQNQWVWEDNILRSFWDSNPDLMWTLENDNLRPMWNFNQTLQWQVDGFIPMPVLTLIILGIADR